MLQVEEEARRARTGAGKPAGGVVLSGFAGVTWRGEEGPAEAGQAVGSALEGTWRRIKRRGGSWGSKKWPAGGSRARRENRDREGLEVDDEDYSAIFQKCRTPL
jgi:hypothetical protein